MFPDAVKAYMDLVQAWRDEQEAKLRAEDGWLTVVGLHWLREGENTLGSDPSCAVLLPERLPAHVGAITLADGVATLRVTADDLSVTVEGEALRETPLHYGEAHTTKVKIERATLFVIQRGDRLAVRVRDADSDARRTFAGRRWFAIDPVYRVTAQFEAHPDDKMLDIETILGTTTRLRNPGAITFDLAGVAHRLEAFEGDEGMLWLVFRDTTSGTLTYGAARFLDAPFNADGTVEVDFNKAKSPPCAFTPYATCPLPPRENSLPIAVLAGEQV